MNLTKLPRELIFLDKKSIDDYDIEDDSSVDGIIYKIIIKRPLAVPTGWDKEKLILSMFNDAYYLSTIIILDKRFSLHLQSWIDYYNSCWNDRLIVSSIFDMVGFCISNTEGLPRQAHADTDELLANYYSINATDFAFKSTLLNYAQKPDRPLTRETFDILDINGSLPKYHTFKGSVDWGLITNNFELNDVIRIVSMIGKSLQGQRFLLNDIFYNYDNSDDVCQEHYELLEILQYNLDKKGVLLNKKQLLEAYKIEQETQQEYFQAEMDSIADYKFEKQKREYEEQIDDLKEKVNQMAREKAALESALSIEKEKAARELNERTKSLNEQHKKERREFWKKFNEQQHINEPEKAFNVQTGMSCFTSRQMGILLTAVGRITESEKSPGKTTLGEIIEKIAGYKSKTASSNMRGEMPQKDTETVAKAIESKFPKLAAEVRKV